MTGLKVISRTSVVALAGAQLTMPEIADTLKVQHVLEGSVRRAGNQARITVQLIEAASDAHVWADSYTRDLTNIFEVQEEIARRVTQALIETVPDLRPPAMASRTEETAAYEAYLKGRQLFHRRTRESFLGAIDAFRTAIELDPDYAPAYAGYAAALALWVTYGYRGDIDPYEAYARAIALADRALELDPDNASAYAARGYVLTKAWAPASRAEADFRRALELQPNSSDIHGWYAHILARVELFDESLAEAQRAVELDPVAPGRRNGYALDALGARRYEDARREAHRSLVIQPGLSLPRALEAMALLLLERPVECLEVDLEIYPATRALCLHSIGREADATAVVDSIAARMDRGEGLSPTLDPAPIYADLATYYAWVGNLEQTLRWTDRAYEASPFGVDYRYIQSALFDRVRDDPRFRELTQDRRQAVWRRVEERASEVRGLLEGEILR